MKATTFAVAMMMTTGAGFADTVPQYRPVLELVSGLCEHQKIEVLNWARQHKSVGSYAVPKLRSGQSVSCSTPIVARSGFSFGFNEFGSADQVALTNCMEANAGVEILGSCVVIGRLRPGPV